MASTAAGLVEKASSDFLIGADWAMNLDICDLINTDPGQAREVIKAVKKRLGNKNPKVQLLALTVLETLIKNCGEIVHQQVAEKDVLTEMVKIVRKKSDMNVRDKILVLIDAWQEAFGGQRGKYPQYFMAYDDLRRSGVEFPERAPENAVPIFTPPKQPTSGPISYDSRAYPSTRLNSVLNPEISSFSATDVGAARSGLEVLNEMLNAIDPRNREAVNDEVILQLVEQCHSNQRKVMQFVNSTIDEESLCQGLALNDDLQRVLAKYNALVTGSPLPMEHKTIPVTTQGVRYDQEEEEADDEFSQLAHRRSLAPTRSTPNQGSKQGIPFTLPPPPHPVTKAGIPLSALEKTIDLLSGETFEDRSQQATPTAPVVSHTGEQLFPYVSEQQAASNPFASSPPFKAIPSQAHTNNSSQHHEVLTDGGLLNPVTQNPSVQHQDNPVGQHTPSGYVVPWAIETLNLQHHGQTLEDTSQQAHSQNVEQQQLQQQMGLDAHAPVLESQYLPAGYKLSASNANNPSFIPQNLQKASPHGKNVVPTLPPPPVLHTQRQQFFQQLSNNNQQVNAGHSGSALNSLEQQANNMTLHDRNRPIGQGTRGSFSSSSGHSSTPLKEAGSKDRLFEELVDLSSMGPKFKAAGISSSLSRPSTNRAGNS